jgi:cysteine desulfurase
MLTRGIDLIAMEAVCGETGAVWNTREVRAAIGAAGSAALLHVDASQAPLTQKITCAHFGADLLTLDASKVGQERGIGCLVAHRTIPLAPLYGGGGQERGLVPGSPSPILASAFARDLEAAARGRETFAASAARMRATLLEHVKMLPDMLVNEGAPQAPHILNLSLIGRDTDYIAALLDEAGFAIATKSACETDSEEGSRAVFAYTGDGARARSTLRISWGPSAGERTLIRFSRALARAVAFVDSARSA